ARRPAWPCASPGDVRRDRVPRLPADPRHLAVRPAERLAAAAVADAPAGGGDRADRAQSHRRTLAQRGARAHRHAPAGVLHAARGRTPAEPLKLEIDLIRARLRAPFVSASGSVEDRELV